MKVIIYNAFRNGDQLFTQPFVQTLVESNPDTTFELALSCSQLLYKDIVENNKNCTFTDGGYPVNWDYNTSNPITNFEHPKYNILCAIRTKPYYVDSDIYINAWSILSNSEDIHCTDNGNRVEYITNILREINEECNTSLVYNITHNDTLLPQFPVLNDTDTIELLKKIDLFFNGKKVILYYNIQHHSMVIKDEKENDQLNVLELKNKYPDHLIVLVKHDNKYPTYISLEKHFKVVPRMDGYNLMINAIIASKCEKVYMKISGGSLFVINKDNVKEKKTEYVFIGPENVKCVIKKYGLNVIN